MKNGRDKNGRFKKGHKGYNPHKGGYKRSEEHKRKLGLIHKGTKLTEEHKRKISKALNKNVTKKCLNCKKMFHTMPSFIKLGGGKYCSWKCFTQNRIGKSYPNLSKAKTGEKNHMWKGGRIKSTRGYILIWKPNHPFHSKKKYVLEHRLVMEKYLKRFLTPKEVVHHINGILDDNRIENLKLFENDIKHRKFHKLHPMTT